MPLQVSSRWAVPPTPPARGFHASAPQLQATYESDGNTLPPALSGSASSGNCPRPELGALMLIQFLPSGPASPRASQKTCPNLGLPRRGRVPSLYSCKSPPRFLAPLINSSASYSFAKRLSSGCQFASLWERIIIPLPFSLKETPWSPPCLAFIQP